MTRSDAPALDRERAISDHRIHDEDHARNRAKLSSFYGRVAEAQDRRILEHCAGPAVLDVGAGYGTLTRRLRDGGFAATGLEIDEEKVRAARQWLGVELRVADFLEWQPDHPIDTVVFRESLNHLELRSTLERAHALARSRCIVFQGTEVLPLRAAQRLYGHQEHDQKTPSGIAEALLAAGFRDVRVLWMDPLAYPLSGGWWAPTLVPRVRWIEDAVLGLDALLERVVCRSPVGPWASFRCLIRGDKARA